jgi:hypothetical protein
MLDASSKRRRRRRRGGRERRTGDDVVGVADSLTQLATRSDGFERDDEAVCLEEYARAASFECSKALRGRTKAVVRDMDHRAKLRGKHKVRVLGANTQDSPTRRGMLLFSIKRNY